MIKKCINTNGKYVSISKEPPNIAIMNILSAAICYYKTLNNTDNKRIRFSINTINRMTGASEEEGDDKILTDLLYLQVLYNKVKDDIFEGFYIFDRVIKTMRNGKLYYILIFTDMAYNYFLTEVDHYDTRLCVKKCLENQKKKVEWYNDYPMDNEGDQYK